MKLVSGTIHKGYSTAWDPNTA